MKPGCDYVIWTDDRSHRKEIGRFCSFSKSPWSKNSSKRSQVHVSATLNGRTCVETSAACTIISISCYFESNSFVADSLSIMAAWFFPFVMFFDAITDLKLVKSVKCLAISVARMIPIIRFLNVLKSSLGKSLIKLFTGSLRIANDSAI